MMEKQFVSKSEDSIALFKNYYLNQLTKTHYSIPLAIYVPTFFYFLTKAMFTPLSILSIFSLFILGSFFWTFTEYTIHRFVFHFHPKTEYGKKLGFLFHGIHHDYPKDKMRLVLPPSVSIPLSILFYLLFKSVMGITLAAPFFAGFIVSYLAYDMLHYSMHHANFKAKWFIKLKQHHMYHHYKNPDAGFAVSNTLWDKIFKTGFKS